MRCTTHTQRTQRVFADHISLSFRVETKPEFVIITHISVDVWSTSVRLDVSVNKVVITWKSITIYILLVIWRNIQCKRYRLWKYWKTSFASSVSEKPTDFECFKRLFGNNSRKLGKKTIHTNHDFVVLIRNRMSAIDRVGPEIPKKIPRLVLRFPLRRWKSDGPSDAHILPVAYIRPQLICAI